MYVCMYKNLIELLLLPIVIIVNVYILLFIS
jgi:hypothetical protein